MAGMAAGSVDAVITDPPYNAGLNYGTYRDDLPLMEYWTWLQDVVNECLRVASGMVIVKHSALKILDWGRFIGKGRMVVWYKPWSSGFPVNGFATHFEPLWVLQGKSARWSKDVLVCSAGNCNHEDSFNHPAQMPETLAKMLVDICTKEMARILDPFMGSGTTGVACVQTGRNFIGIEINPAYFAIAEKRIRAAQAQLVMPLEVVA